MVQLKKKRRKYILVVLDDKSSHLKNFLEKKTPLKERVKFIETWRDSLFEFWKVGNDCMHFLDKLYSLLPSPPSSKALLICFAQG